MLIFHDGPAHQTDPVLILCFQEMLLFFSVES